MNAFADTTAQMDVEEVEEDSKEEESEDEDDEGMSDT